MPPSGKSKSNYNPTTATTIKFVPQLTDFFDSWPAANGPDGKSWKGKLTRTWIRFFEQQQAAAAGQVCLRTLIVYNTATGVNNAPDVPIYQAGTGLYLIAVLRTAISADLVVNINLNGTAIATVTIPSATPVYPAAGCVIFAQFLASGQAFNFNPTGTPPTADLLGASVTSSDGSSDPNGVATITVMWTATVGVVAST
jgi:hypothetical protein